MSRYKLELTKERHDKIKSEISKRYNLEWYRIESKSRVREVVDARRLYCGLLKNTFGLNNSKIAKIINKHHATVLHNINQHDIFVGILKSYKKNFNEIESLLVENDNYYIHEILSVERKMDALSDRLEQLIERKNNYKLKIQKNVRKKLCSK
tara:strand:+ start:2447 stop:2902 length:456 start_codon:yes stop_codon:yes gene_type:complete